MRSGQNLDAFESGISKIFYFFGCRFNIEELKGFVLNNWYMVLSFTEIELLKDNQV